MSFGDFMMAAFVVVFFVNLGLAGLMCYLLIKIAKLQGGNGAFVVIRDALTGEAARVKAGRQVVRSVGSSISGFMADEGWHFSANTGFLNLPDNFSGGVLYFRNDNPLMHFYVNKIVMGWTPNNINSNENARMSVDFQNTEPKARAMNAPGGNTHRGHSRTTAEARLFSMVWDRSSDHGFEGSEGGITGIPYTIKPGEFIHEIEGNIILDTGQSLTFMVFTKEVGTFHISLTGWLAPEF